MLPILIIPVFKSAIVISIYAYGQIIPGSSSYSIIVSRSIGFITIEFAWSYVLVNAPLNLWTVKPYLVITKLPLARSVCFPEIHGSYPARISFYLMTARSAIDKYILPAAII